VGESGCGKSVSVLSVMRLIPTPPGKIVGGSVIFQGRDLLKASDDEVRQVRGNRMAMIFQDPMTSLNPVLTIGGRSARPWSFTCTSRTTKPTNGAPSCSRWWVSRGRGAPERLSAPVFRRHASEGNDRHALACNPQLLIADEPTTALDVTIQAQIVELVKRLRDEIGMAIIWITHDLGVVAGLADRVQVMYAGYVVEEAVVKELYANPRHPYTLGCCNRFPAWTSCARSGCSRSRGCRRT